MTTTRPLPSHAGGWHGLLVAMSMLLATSTAAAIDWKGVPEKSVVLLYPGQASWEWVMTQSDHSGAGKFREGKTCSGCHDGEQADMGKALLSGTHKAESAPVKNKPGSQTLTVQTAHDARLPPVIIRNRPDDAGRRFGVVNRGNAARIGIAPGMRRQRQRRPIRDPGTQRVDDCRRSAVDRSASRKRTVHKQ